MSFNDPIFWSLVVTMCSIALLTEVARVVHVLFITRKRLWLYLLAVMAVAMSIWSFAVALYTSNNIEYLSLVTHFHITRAWWLAMIPPLIQTCQLQIGLTIVFFAILIFIERKVLPQTDQPSNMGPCSKSPLPLII
jgi:hypothetical protein